MDYTFCQWESTIHEYWWFEKTFEIKQSVYWLKPIVFNRNEKGLLKNENKNKKRIKNKNKTKTKKHKFKFFEKKKIMFFNYKIYFSLTCFWKEKLLIKLF